MSCKGKICINTEICHGQYVLRSIVEEDIEVLRIWKNEHKEFFFQKREISPEEQLEWYRSFSCRENDHMFVVLRSMKYVGCIGTRKQGDCIDLYNIILGDKRYRGTHVMSKALLAVASFSKMLYPHLLVRVRVLKSNPAVGWYQKIGFSVIDDMDEFVIMQLSDSLIKNSYDLSFSNPFGVQEGGSND